MQTDPAVEQGKIVRW